MIRPWKPDGQGVRAGALRAAIGLYREAGLLRRAYARKRQDGGPAYADLYRLSLALQVFPVETVLPWLTAFDAAADGPAETGDAGTTRLMISGSLCADEALFTEIAALGGNIVVDDTCIGYRTLLGGAAPEGDPLTALARHHLARPPCSARADFPARRAYFLEQIEAFRVEAVVFIHQKFCDPTWPTTLPQDAPGGTRDHVPAGRTGEG